MSKTGEPNHAIDELARTLARFRPDDERAEQVRTETLARVAELAVAPPRRSRAVLWVALPVAAAAGLVWFLLARGDGSAETARPVIAERPVTPPRADTVPSRIEEVRPHEGADFERTADSIDLRDGALEVEVRAARNERPVRIATRDAAVTALNARFAVEARGDRLLAIIVQEGRVEMQSSAESTPRVVAAGEVWRAEAERDVATPHEHAAAKPAAPRHKPKEMTTGVPPAMATPPVMAAPGEPEFRAGWTALRAGKARAAADSFAAARHAAGDSGLGEDAHFWQGMALARAGDRARAIAVLREFVSEHPRSARTGEASAKLGWLLYESGRLDDAERAFQSAAGDRVPSVKKSAHDGLEAIERRRPGQERDPR